MDRKKAILKATIVTMVGFSILIVLLCVEAVYFDWSHSIYALIVALVLKFAIAINFTRTINRITEITQKKKKIQTKTLPVSRII
ncbi:MAG: hypothetical protein V4649_20050 [Bacteroidota bacterium]